MNTHYLSRGLYLFTTSLLLLAATLSCKKDEPENPLLACRPSGSGGVGIANPRTIMFWIKQDLGCGILHLNSIRNTETNGTSYGGPVNANITQFFSTQPACGTTGTITIQVSQGYEYEYNISCTGRQWKDKVTVDCKSTDCIAVQLQ